jgi:hypothetical protein
MDESWRRRQPTIQTNQDSDYLAPDDFRDVFGGPPRSVLLHHFSPSTQHVDSRFGIMKREDNPPCTTVFCKPEFVSTIRCGRNGFLITKREAETANNKRASYKPGLAGATSTPNGHIRRVTKREGNLHYDETFRKLDHVSTTSYTRKRERHPSLIPVFQKWDGLSTSCDVHKSFRAMERYNNSSYDTRSDLSAPIHFADNGFQVMKSEFDDMCLEDAFVYNPVSGQHPTISCGSPFQALRREEGFYDDIFGVSVCGDSNAGLRRSRSISISKCESESTAVSCCEDGLLANAVYGYEGDGVFSSFASKLRLVLFNHRIISL